MSQATVQVDSTAGPALTASAVIPVLPGATTGTGDATAYQYTLTDLAAFFVSVDGPFVMTAATPTPSAFVSTTFYGFSSTTLGAALMGFGTTNDVSLLNRAGTTVLGITANTTTVALAGALSITGALSGVTTLGASTSVTVTSASASALAVGLAGATNPAFVVDSSTGSQAAGLKVTGATAAGTVAVAVISSGADANLSFAAKGTGTISLLSALSGTSATFNNGAASASTLVAADNTNASAQGGSFAVRRNGASIGGMLNRGVWQTNTSENLALYSETGLGIEFYVNGSVTRRGYMDSSNSFSWTSASATAFAVGLAGATNPAFVVDSSTGSQAAGFSVTGAVAAGTVALAVISSGADASVTLNAKGTGTIGIGSVSTGAVSIVPILGATLKCMVSTTAGASLNLGNAGTAPTSPNNGDMWIESNTIKVRLNGATVTVTTA